MISSIRRKSNQNIAAHLLKLDQSKATCSFYLPAIAPWAEQMRVYAMLGAKELLLVYDETNLVRPANELADEEPFNDEPPLYFSELDHRISPIYKMTLVRDIVARVLEQVRIPMLHIFCLVLSPCAMLNEDDMRRGWLRKSCYLFSNQTHLCFSEEKGTEDPKLLRMCQCIVDYMQHHQKELYALATNTFERLNYALSFTHLGAHDDDEPTFSEPKKKSETTLFDDGTMEELEEPLHRRVVEPPIFRTTDDEDYEEVWDGQEVEYRTIEHHHGNVRVPILKPFKHPQEALKKMVGCKEIKEQMEDLFTMTRYNKLMRQYNPQGKRHRVALHGIFYGRPGTGKTSMCKIYGSLLHEAGALSSGHVVMCSRSTFIGTCFGDEEQTVNKVLEMAKGGVLMIDEAYQLNAAHHSDPGKNVIPLLMDILGDETRRDIAIVLSGYKEPMEKLLEINPGLDSRFPNRFEFADFTLDELFQIALLKTEEYNYKFTSVAWAKFKKLVAEAYDMRDKKKWGNARYITNLLERIYIQHAKRCIRQNVQDKNTMLRLTPSDIIPIPAPKARPRIGFQTSSAG